MTGHSQRGRAVLSRGVKRKVTERDLLFVITALTGGAAAVREAVTGDPESATETQSEEKADAQPTETLTTAEEVKTEGSAEETVEDRIAEATRVEELVWEEREKRLPEAERAVRRRVRAARRRARFEKEMKAEIAKHELAARREKQLKESETYWQRFMEGKDIYEVEKDNIRHKLGEPLKSVDTLRELHEGGVLTLTTVGELRGRLHEAGRQAAQIQAQVDMYVKTVKSLLNIPEDSTAPVDPELVALCGDFFIQRSMYIEERKDVQSGGVYTLRGYSGFSNFFGRKQEELWYLMNEEGRIRRELLRADQGVLEFTSMGEMLVHKAALANAKRLRDWWTTDRWKWLAIVDKRVDSDSVARTEGMSGLMRILNIFKNIFRKMLEARSASDEDYDYPFELPFQKPHFGVRAVWTAAEEAKYEQLHYLPLTGALSHNDVLPEYRMRTNMNKTTWYEYWFQEKCWMMSIPMIHIDHLLDTGGKKH